MISVYKVRSAVAAVGEVCFYVKASLLSVLSFPYRNKDKQEKEKKHEIPLEFYTLQDLVQIGKPISLISLNICKSYTKSTLLTCNRVA